MGTCMYVGVCVYMHMHSQNKKSYMKIPLIALSCYCNQVDMYSQQKCKLADSINLMEAGLGIVAESYCNNT